MRRGIISGGPVSWALMGFMVRHSGVSMQVSKSGDGMEVRQEEGREKSSGVVHDEKSLKSVQSRVYDNQRSSREGGETWVGAKGGCGWIRSAERHSASPRGARTLGVCSWGHNRRRRTRNLARRETPDEGVSRVNRCLPLRISSMG